MYGLDLKITIMQFKRHFFAILAVAVLAFGVTHIASAATYRVMYADGLGWGAPNTLVHVWDSSSVPLNEWAANGHMESTGKYLRQGDRYLPVYEYVFEWDKEPVGIIFHYKGSTIQTIDLDFSGGAMYQFVGKGGDKSDAIVENPVLVDSSELPRTKVYFADTGNWGAANTQIHIWGTNGDFSPFLSDPTMTDTGKYARVNDVWAKVYVFEYLYEGTATGLMFHKQNANLITADFTATDGALYTYTGNKKPAPTILEPTLVDEIPAEPRPASLYVNLGANQMMRSGLWEEPCAHVYRRDPSGNVDYEAQLPEYGSEQYKAEVMTKIRDGFYRIDIDDINSCDDVIFYYSRVNQQGEHTYKDLAFPASRGAYNDPSTWATFIYDIGIDCVHQSYLTPEEYNDGWEESPAALYLTGNELVTGKVSDDPVNCVRIESDDDVYIHKFSLTAGDVANFKLSRFDASGAAQAHGFSVTDKTYESQRGWATFNLGIIGFQNDDEPGWEEKYIYTPGEGQSRQVRLWLNESVNFNSYNQYPWRLGEGEGGVAAGDYWLVIDLHDADHSLSLLEFDPNPAVEMTASSFSVIEAGYDALGAYMADCPLAGSESNGKVLFDRVNVLSATGTASGKDAGYLHSLDYTVSYTLLLDGTPVAVHETLPDVLTVPFMTPGEEADIALRARYTDTATNHSFCSRKVHASLTAPSPQLPSPKENTVDGEMFLYFAAPGDEETMAITVGGAAKLPYALDADTPHAFYPDFVVEEVTSDIVGETVSSVVVADNHFVASRDQFADYLGKQSSSPWISWSDGEEYSDTHNWSKYIASEGRLPLFLDCLGTVGSIDTPVSSSAKVTLHAVYPFLVIPKGQIAGTSRFVRGLAATALPDGVENLALHTITTSTPSYLDFSGRTISGVEPMTADVMTDGEEVWHTLSGILLDRKPSLPGIYLRTKGGDSEKYVIR